MTNTISYEEISTALKDLPMTWYPALLKIAIDAAISKNCFKVGGVSAFAKTVEDEVEHPPAVPHQFLSDSISQKDREVIDAAWLEYKSIPVNSANPPKLADIAERLMIQDNRMTENPMFCVQVKKRSFGYDADYATDTVWMDEDFEEVPEGTPGAKKFGYVDRWETVMVAFTEKGCEEYLKLNGHNDRARAYNGEVRIYVESFNRCPEMIAIRHAVMSKKL